MPSRICAAKNRTLEPPLLTLFELDELALAHQNELFNLEAGRLRNAQRHEFLRFEAASTQFAMGVKMAIQYLEMPVEEKATQQGINFCPP